jgi:hypothetical protein
MSLEVVNLQVPDLGLVEDLADVVHQTLDGPDPPGGGGGSGVSISIGAGPGSSRSFASSDTSEVQDPMTAWSCRSAAASGDWDPAAATALGSFIGPGS